MSGDLLGVDIMVLLGFLKFILGLRQSRVLTVKSKVIEDLD